MTRYQLRDYAITTSWWIFLLFWIALATLLAITLTWTLVAFCGTLVGVDVPLPPAGRSR